MKRLPEKIFSREKQIKIDNTASPKLCQRSLIEIFCIIFSEWNDHEKGI